MPSYSINTGPEFIFSKLHCWWGKSASGERLRALTACVTEENFLRTLSGFDFKLPKNADFEKSLMVRQISMLQDIIALADPAFSRFLRAMLISITEENLKVILNCRFFPERATPVAEMLTPIPGAEPLPADQLLQVPELEEFIALLCAEFTSPGLEGIIRKLAEDHNIMAAECAIDALDFQRQLDSAGAMPLVVRRQARQMVGWEIDITNIIMLLRNINLYHFPDESLAALWLAGGCQVRPEQLTALGQSRRVEDAIPGLPAPYSAWLQMAYQSGELYLCEHALWNFLSGKGRALFRDFNTPQLSLVAFPYLLRFETINLARIYEGIRFGLPVKSIQSMMIGES